MKKYVFQEERSEFREITYEADSFEEAYKKWEDGQTPTDATEWDHGDDNEISLTECFFSEEEDE